MNCAQCGAECETGALYGGLCGDCALEAMPPYMELVALMADLHARLEVAEAELRELRRGEKAEETTKGKTKPAEQGTLL